MPLILCRKEGREGADSGRGDGGDGGDGGSVMGSGRAGSFPSGAGTRRLIVRMRGMAALSASGLCC